VAGIVFYFVHPVLLDLIITAESFMLYPEFRRNSLHRRLHSQWDVKPPSGLVYHPRYNLTFCGLENMHPFDSIKYKRTIEFLEQKQAHYPWLEFFLKGIHRPSKASRRQILDVMSCFYVFKLNYTVIVCKIIELPLVFLPNCLVKWRVLDPMLYSTQGSIDAACMAVHKGWAINIGGGYHHACGKEALALAFTRTSQ
jgi:histone deacetylase 11